MLAAHPWRIVVTPRRLRRMRILIVPPFIVGLWAAMLLLAIYTNVVGWFAAKDLGDARWVQYPLIQLGFTVGFIADDLRRHWIEGVAHALHFEDVIDDVCPDRGSEINEAAVWRWYEKRGRPLWLSPRRERPQVRFVDARARMNAYHESMLADQRRRWRLRKNHRV
jgi:hypothetical protein